MATDITWRTTKMPDAILGVPYEASLGVTGNIAGALSAGSVSTGALPDGLSISAEKIRITGTPTVLGTFTFKITLADSPDTGVESGSLSIRVRDVARSDEASLSTADKNAADAARLRLA